MQRVVIVTVPGMIAKDDWTALEELAEVTYVERDHVNQEELLEIIKDQDYLMLNYDVVESLNEDFYREIKERGLPLKAISSDITGMSWASPDAAKKYNIPLMEIPGYSTLSVAEFSLASLLLHVKKMHLSFLDKKQGNEMFVRKNDVLEGKTLGIIGLGNIGTKMAKLGSALGMHVIAWNRSPKSVDNVENVSLDDLFRRSDFISVNLKTAPETEGLVNKKYLNMAKDSVIIINQADGKIVNNDDMLEAIRSGKVGGYSTSSEAIKDHPLEEEANVTSFPPQAWFTDDSLNNLRRIWVNNIVNAMNGELDNLT